NRLKDCADVSPEKHSVAGPMPGGKNSGEETMCSYKGTGGLQAVLAAIMMFAAVSIATAQGVDINDTRLLTQPAISKNHIAFIYAGDLWSADLDGKNVRRLTADEGLEANPVFSPDGSLIAFTGQYDGNLDVYVIPVMGGVPTRLTWHPGPDIVQGFTPD